MSNIIFRVGELQKRIYETAAKTAGMSLSEWLKGLADEASATPLGAVDPRLEAVLERKVPGKKRVVMPAAVNTPEAVEEKLTEVVEKNVYTKKKRVYTGEKVMRNGHMAYEIIVDGRKTWTFDEEE